MLLSMTGQTISHYKILEKLGEGGMGVVYKATDTKLERTVALKFLAADRLENEEHKARFRREARAAAALDHPNICTVYEIDEAQGQTFLAMPYLEGGAVRRTLGKRKTKLSPKGAAGNHGANAAPNLGPRRVLDDQAPLLKEPIRPQLFAYLGGIVRSLGGEPLIVNGVADHVVCRACLEAWGWKSSAQLDGSEVLGKRKGVAARRGLEEAWNKTAT